MSNINNEEEFLVAPKSRAQKPNLGDNYGDYTVISDQIFKKKDENSSKSYWLLKCKCENECFVRSDIVKSGQATKCRYCANKQNYIKNIELGLLDSKNYSTSHQGYKDLCLTFFNDYKAGARKRNLSFEISIEYAYNLLESQNFKCALTGQEIWLRPIDKTIPLTINGNLQYHLFNASLDRIDSSKGYIEGNLQWVERKINQVKMDLSQEEFIKMCKMVTSYVNQQPS